MRSRYHRYRCTDASQICGSQPFSQALVVRGGLRLKYAPVPIPFSLIGNEAITDASADDFAYMLSVNAVLESLK